LDDNSAEASQKESQKIARNEKKRRGCVGDGSQGRKPVEVSSTAQTMVVASIGVIGGSGIYSMSGITVIR
jgi:hypothetical protein